MLLIVLVGVVRVSGVSAVGRDHDAALQGGEEIAATATARGHDSLEKRGNHPAAGASGGGRADLLVVEHDEHRHADQRGGVGRYGEESFDGGEARELVVDPSRRDQVAIAADEGGRLRIERHDLRGHDLVGVDIGQPRQVLDERTGVVVAECPQRRHLCLWVQQEAILADLPIEMDRELWHTQDRPRICDQSVLDAGIGSYLEPAGETEITVEPAVEEHPAIDLHPQLCPAGSVLLCSGLDSQVRRVGVGADEGETLDRPVGLDPRDQGAPLLHEAATRLARKCRAEGAVHEPAGGEAAGGLGHGVVRSRRGVDPAHQPPDRRGRVGAEGLGRAGRCLVHGADASTPRRTPRPHSGDGPGIPSHLPMASPRRLRSAGAMKDDGRMAILR